MTDNGSITKLRNDMKKFATKADAKKTERALRSEILRVEEKVETLQEGQDDIKATLVKLQNTLDGFVGAVDTLRTDNEVGAHHTKELTGKIENHEKRIKRLESSHQTA